MPNWFDAEVDALIARTSAAGTGDGAVLFYGSSSFTLWHDLDRHFPAFAVVNHGFGGSTLSDCLACFDRLVVPVAPGAIILYAGDNDLDQGVAPEAVLALVRHFIARKRAALGAVPMAYVSIKVSPARLHFMHRIGYTNRIVERALAAEPEVTFLDVTRRMVGRGMEAWRRYYGDDPLHMNAEGYRLWARAIGEYLAALGAEGYPLRRRAPAAPAH